MENQETKQKIAKPKSNIDSTTKNFIKEIKRIRWPKSSKVWKWFGITIAFLVVMAIFCFLVTLGFTTIWNAIGIKS
ncbi:preprotein translocase subunit SecE [Metamycoplasma hyosynoviae]|uniref:preprotein translocase subunit SecE n=1 Tax=Metamycoplasma hyosynoviae TaxID=29559 RepID=UPI002365962C|nr:preprotein translocase subunit SecE [Metamycoplasma hyosynoviae]MDD7912805.1 preprotein translocase subunit SecE [Metamycoplasma hyosynoviae]